MEVSLKIPTSEISFERSSNGGLSGIEEHGALTQAAILRELILLLVTSGPYRPPRHSSKTSSHAWAGEPAARRWLFTFA
jgi:hypothetical protein